MSRQALVTTALMAMLAGCAADQPTVQLAALDAPPPTSVGAVAERTGYGRYARLPRSAYEEALAERVAALSAEPMTQEAAVEVGILADPSIRELLRDHGLQRPATVTDLAEPDARLPFEWRLVELVMANRNRGDGGGELIASGSWAYGELYADLAHAVMERANEIRRYYVEAVAAGEAARLYDRVLDAAKASAELANEQYRSGTLSRLEQARRHLGYVETYKEAVAARREAMASREALRRELSLTSAQAAWPLPERLPDLPAQRPVIADVEAVALANRPEALAVGASPTSPLGARIAAEARDSYERMLLAYDTARFQRDSVLPAARIMLEEMQLHYNAMLEDVYELIEAAEANIEAGKDYVADLAEFWIAHAELSDVLGGQVPEPATAALATASLNPVETTEEPGSRP